jgi:hypothetical protein
MQRADLAQFEFRSISPYVVMQAVVLAGFDP